MSYTLGQAARATGKSKPTIQRAIKNGVISAIKNENGSYLIDPAELHRVFSPVSDTDEMKQSVPPLLQGETEVLRDLLEQVKSERDDLRRRLDAEGEERRKSADEIRRLTLLLTHQREPTEADDPRPAPKAEPEPLGAFWVSVVSIVATLSALAIGAALTFHWWR